jgi:aminoglycoside phosphotransferase (APT) family kinase protein
MANENNSTGRSALDPLTILGALGVSDVTEVAPVSGGADAALWRVETRTGTYALRVLGPDQATQAATEVAAMTAAANGGVPVPRLHATGTWRDHPALLLSWCRGESMAAALRADPAQSEGLALGFGRTQALIHAIPAPLALPHSSDAWIDWGEPDEALRLRLRELSVERPVLLHLDYHPLNVLVEASEVSAVLDWANARAGDPRADLARTSSILHFAPIPDTIPADRASALGRPDLPWLTPAYLDRVRRWAAQWRHRAGL